MRILLAIVALASINMAPTVRGQSGLLRHQALTGSGDVQPIFAVATIRPSKGNGGWKLEFTPDGFVAKNVTLRQVIQEAYGMFQENRLSGGPGWVNSAKFDIEAKMADTEAPLFQSLRLDQRMSMLQVLLASRFKLRVRHETKLLPAYALIVAKGAPKLKKSDPHRYYHGPIEGIDGLVTRSEPGLLAVQGFTMAELSQLLYSAANLTVVDQTNLAGRFDFEVRWAPDDLRAQRITSPDGQERTMWSAGQSLPSIFTAIKEQLGLELKPIRHPEDTIVIEHVEQPSQN